MLVTNSSNAWLLPDEKVINKIYMFRGQKVMLDKDLAELYGVETKVLNQAVKRNLGRFPPDFMFQLTADELEVLKSQIVTSSWGGARKLPFAFTEMGVSMLSGVLKSEIAIKVHIQIIRVFAKMREHSLGNKDILRKLEKIEKSVAKHDADIVFVFQHLRKLLAPPQLPRERIGFRRAGEK